MSGQNQVDVDQAALEREAASLDIPADSNAAPGEAGEGAAPGADAPGGAIPGELTPEEAERRAAALAPAIVKFLEGTTRTLCPAWKVTPDECAALGQSYALVAVYWFPDLQLPPKWAALATAGLLTFGVLESRRDTEGKLIPRKLEAAQRPAGADAEPNYSAPASTGSGGFTTSA